MGREDARDVAIPSIIIPQISLSESGIPFWSRGMPSGGKMSWGRGFDFDFDFEDFDFLACRCFVDEEVDEEEEVVESESDEEDDSSMMYFGFRFLRCGGGRVFLIGGADVDVSVVVGSLRCFLVAVFGLTSTAWGMGDDVDVGEVVVAEPTPSMFSVITSDIFIRLRAGPSSSLESFGGCGEMVRL